MDLRALRYFVELIRQQSFTRAADRLCVTQPTISKMIRALEEEAGQPLLLRQGHRFALTDAGQIVYQHALHMLDQLQQMQAGLADLQALQRGRLALGVPPLVGPVVADLLSRYRRRWPAVELHIVEYGGLLTEQALLEGQLDLAINMMPGPNSELLASHELDSHLIQAVLPDTARWHAMPQVNLADLREEPLLLFSEDFLLSGRLEQACRDAGFTPQVAARSSQWDFLMAMVRSGMGVAFMPAPIGRRLSLEGLLLRPLLPAIEWRLGLLWPKARYLSRPAEAWLQLCREMSSHHSV